MTMSHEPLKPGFPDVPVSSHRHCVSALARALPLRNLHRTGIGNDTSLVRRGIGKAQACASWAGSKPTLQKCLMPFLGRFLRKPHLEGKVLWRGPVDGGGETGRVWTGSNLDLGSPSPEAIASSSFRRLPTRPWLLQSWPVWLAASTVAPGALLSVLPLAEALVQIRKGRTETEHAHSR